MCPVIKELLIKKFQNTVWFKHNLEFIIEVLDIEDWMDIASTLKVKEIINES